MENKTNKIVWIIWLITISSAISGQDIPVFISGQEGYKSYRIPAIIKAPNGELLAFAEGRVDHAGDFGNVDIVMKRSKDRGKSWSKLAKVVDYGIYQAGNSAPVVDRLDPNYPGGRIFLFYNTGVDHESAVRKGHAIREVWYVTSVDNGVTWAPPVNITPQVHKPNAPTVNPAYSFEEAWRCYANTPGHGIQIDGGTYKGRVYIAANHSAGDPLPAYKDYKAHGFYTDDHGKSFNISSPVSFEGGNESTAAWLGRQTIMMNSRNQQGNVPARIVSISTDGGTTWDTTYYDYQLPDPVNQGSLLAFDIKGRSYLAFSNTADTLHRDNLTLRISVDEGKTWFFQRNIASAPDNYKGAYAAYSDIVKLRGKRIGILYEKDDYRQIVFASVKWR